MIKCSIMFTHATDRNPLTSQSALELLKTSLVAEPPPGGSIP